MTAQSSAAERTQRSAHRRLPRETGAGTRTAVSALAALALLGAAPLGTAQAAAAQAAAAGPAVEASSAKSSGATGAEAGASAAGGSERGGRVSAGADGPILSSALTASEESAPRLAGAASVLGPGMWHETKEGKTWYGAYRTFPGGFAYCVDAGLRTPRPEHFPTAAPAAVLTSPETAWAVSEHHTSDSPDVQAALSALVKFDDEIPHRHAISPRHPRELGSDFRGAADSYRSIEKEAAAAAGPYTLTVEIGLPEGGESTGTATVSLLSAAGEHLSGHRVDLDTEGAVPADTHLTTGDAPTVVELTDLEAGTVTVSAEARELPATTLRLHRPEGKGTERVQSVVTAGAPTRAAGTAEAVFAPSTPAPVPTFTAEVPTVSPEPTPEETPTPKEPEETPVPERTPPPSPEPSTPDVPQPEESESAPPTPSEPPVPSEPPAPRPDEPGPSDPPAETEPPEEAPEEQETAPPETTPPGSGPPAEEPEDAPDGGSPDRTVEDGEDEKAPAPEAPRGGSENGAEDGRTDTGASQEVPASLPRTGASTYLALGLGLCLIGAGGVTIALTRRR